MRGIFLILSVAVIALVFTSSTLAAEDCYDKDLKLTIKRGETVYPEGECLRMSCSEEGEIEPEPCMLEIPPNCNIVDGDMSQKYPGCCPTIKCDDE